VIVFCSFGLHVILDGITYSFGVIFVALLEDFQGGKGDTAWILSIFVGVTLGTGEAKEYQNRKKSLFNYNRNVN